MRLQASLAGYCLCEVLPLLRSPGAGETLLHDLFSHLPERPI